MIRSAVRPLCPVTSGRDERISTGSESYYGRPRPKGNLFYHEVRLGWNEKLQSLSLFSSEAEQHLNCRLSKGDLGASDGRAPRRSRVKVFRGGSARGRCIYGRSPVPPI